MADYLVDKPLTSAFQLSIPRQVDTKRPLHDYAFEDQTTFCTEPRNGIETFGF